MLWAFGGTVCYGGQRAEEACSSQGGRRQSRKRRPCAVPLEDATPVTCLPSARPHHLPVALCASARPATPGALGTSTIQTAAAWWGGASSHWEPCGPGSKSGTPLKRGKGFWTGHLALWLAHGLESSLPSRRSLLIARLCWQVLGGGEAQWVLLGWREGFEDPAHPWADSEALVVLVVGSVRAALKVVEAI